jgi:multidrug resistance efflux pump
MFKHISEILKQFTSAQKTLALLMLLLSIILMTLGPKMIDATSIDNTEYKSKVDRQILEIKDLQMTVDSLDTKIRNGQRQCTNEIAQRESEFIAMLDELKYDMNKTSTSKIIRKPDVVPVREPRRDYEIIHGDTIRVARMEVYPAPVEQTTQTSKDAKVDLKKIVNKIESMKAKLKN